MPYAKINPTGCGIHKNRAKLRLDFFLNPDDPNYDKHHIYAVDETSKKYQQVYKGKMDEDGIPLDLEDYQEWLDGLPHIWRDNPFHSHILRIDKDISDAELKAKIESCLNYFYLFHQYCWDGGKQFIEEWKKVPIQHGTVRERLTAGDIKDVPACEGKVAYIVSRRDEFQLSPSEIPPQDLNIGEEGTIDVGAAAIDRSSYGQLYFAPTYATYVEKSNPANDTGEIDTVECWFALASSGNSVKFGTFEHLGSNELKCHDAEEYGEVSAGSKQTCSGLSIDISTGEYIGADPRAAQNLWIDKATIGGTGVWALVGQFCDPNDQEIFAYNIFFILSLYGTGTTGGAALEKNLSDTVIVGDALIKDITLNKVDTLAIADALSKTFGIVKSTTLAIADSISKGIGLSKSESVGITDSEAKATGLNKVDTVTIADSFASAMSYIRSLTDNVGIMDSISKAVSIIKSDTVTITDSIITDVITYLRQAIDRMEVKGMDIARMGIKRMNIGRMPLFRWIIRRWTA